MALGSRELGYGMGVSAKEDRPGDPADPLSIANIRGTAYLHREDGSTFQRRTLPCPAGCGRMIRGDELV
jgi:hypothetical protein